MKSPKKTDPKKSAIKNTPGKDVKKTSGSAADPALNNRFTDDDDDFDEPLDELEGFDEYTSFDDDDDY